MLTRRLASTARLQAARLGSRRLPIVQRRCFWPESFNSKRVIDEKFPDEPSLTAEEDPDMNGGYINPPYQKRQFRDPYGDWWDKQERRNFGEPMHEDNDMLAMLSPHEYTHTTPGRALLMLGGAASALAGLVGIVYLTYPDKQAYPREFEDGLERELGGKGALRARKAGDPFP